MKTTDKIYVAGHTGMLGSAIVRQLTANGYTNLLLQTSSQLDLRNQQLVNTFFENHQPEYVFIAAAKVGGIMANNVNRADFIYDNLMMQSNIIHASFIHKVKKLLFIGSSCIYPKLAPQPLHENYLLTGALEYTNEPYAVAKIAGIKMCEAYRTQHGCNFITALPTNLYGTNDYYDLNNSHVLPALLRKFIEAKTNHADEVIVWGTGKPLREFMHVNDAANACIFLMKNYDDIQPINVGIGSDISISDIAYLIKKIVGYTGKIKFDTTKPDGTLRKLLAMNKLYQLGWKHTIELEQGIRTTYEELMNKGFD
ncbi:MAG: hypothetical protein RJA07_1741 [Bacteroidota bacterium]|jgi:GDP-L-fucose synthase